MQCIADGDNGATKTSPILEDTDFGSIKDGIEDRDHDGVIDMGETNPNDPADDAECATDMDCGDSMSGSVCVDGACTPGCRSDGSGNGCPDGQICVTQNDGVGTCQEFERYAGGGCACSIEAEGEEEEESFSSLALIALAILFTSRRKQR
jgi:hypothetical protein